MSDYHVADHNGLECLPEAVRRELLRDHAGQLHVNLGSFVEVRPPCCYPAKVVGPQRFVEQRPRLALLQPSRPRSTVHLLQAGLRQLCWHQFRRQLQQEALEGQ
jgi:hypothetical protein